MSKTSSEIQSLVPLVEEGFRQFGVQLVNGTAAAVVEDLMAEYREGKAQGIHFYAASGDRHRITSEVGYVTSVVAGEGSVIPVSVEHLHTAARYGQGIDPTQMPAQTSSAYEKALFS